MALRILYFSQEGCMACEEQEPIIAEVEKDCNVNVERISISPRESREVIRDYRLTVTPTIVVIRDGAEVERFEGLVYREQMDEAIRRHL
ncbi:MAG: thioredoxin 2 [Methanoregulaceae archaeon PtaB.Bin056]|jgi:thioredoxin 1|nr:MAG: thioredoxin 2 [Methanoregulaceae archaeon PtaB.Bin056]